MLLDELIAKLQEAREEYGGLLEVILDTDLSVAPLGNVRIPDNETIVLEV